MTSPELADTGETRHYVWAGVNGKQVGRKDCVECPRSWDRTPSTEPDLPSAASSSSQMPLLELSPHFQAPRGATSLLTVYLCADLAFTSTRMF